MCDPTFLFGMSLSSARFMGTDNVGVRIVFLVFLCVVLLPIVLGLLFVRNPLLFFGQVVLFDKETIVEELKVRFLVAILGTDPVPLFLDGLVFLRDTSHDVRDHGNIRVYNHLRSDKVAFQLLSLVFFDGGRESGVGGSEGDLEAREGIPILSRTNR